jgi:hypothetical protein
MAYPLSGLSFHTPSLQPERVELSLVRIDQYSRSIFTHREDSRIPGLDVVPQPSGRGVLC